jgi:hypothetical protein
MEKEIYEKIIAKKDFSYLPKCDVEKIYSLFDKPRFLPEEKIKLTRDLLRKVFSVFTSEKILNPKILEKKSAQEILKKHISTRERFDFYLELYEKLLKDFSSKTFSIIDLGAGINGLSYSFFNDLKLNVNYLGVEAVGQLVELMNSYFEQNKFNAKAIFESLFNLERIKEIILSQKIPRVVFLFKAVDSLEMVERNYSKKLLEEIVPLADRVVVSFATRSLVSKKKFNVKRYWFENFVKENFKILDDFEIGGERYLVFCKN